MVREKKRLENLGVSEQPSLSEMEFGNYAPFTYSLESSRAATSALVALVSLKSLGIQGFQKLIAQLMNSSEMTRQRINRLEGFQTVNNDAMGFVTLFVIFPPYYKTTYNEVFNSLCFDEVIEIAEYNYKFYLYMLELQITDNYPIAVDYISGYDLTASSAKIGVLKIYPMSPFYDKKYVDTLLQLLISTKKQFDLVFKDFTPKFVPYRPKPFVTR
jgi:hypothetical protein